MVLPGQFLERPTLIARPDPWAEGGVVTLEGLFHRGSRAPAVVVCPPHPRLGGSMDSPVVAELAWSLTKRGRATLRFNYQGVGASGGTLHASAPDGHLEKLALAALSSEVGDASAAVNLLTASVPDGKVAIVGYSFGAAVALALVQSRPAIRPLILVSPPTTLFDWELLRSVQQPTLIVVGHKDPLVDRQALSPLLPDVEGSRLEVIAHADHVFSRGLTELGRVVGDWLESLRTVGLPQE